MSGQLLEIPICEVFPDTSQPRKTLPPDALERMAASLKARGMLSPIRVRWDEPRQCWVIISGETRWRAAKLASLSIVPCLVAEGELSEVDILSDQLIENTVRNDLRPLEEARAFAKLKKLRDVNSLTLAKEIGISPASITRAESLLTLPEDVQMLVDDGRVPEASAYEISRLPDEASQRQLALAVAEGKLSREKTAEMVRAVIGKRNVKPKASRVACRLEGGLTFSISADSALSWESLRAAISRLSREIERLQKSGKEVSALGRLTAADGR